MKIIKQGETIYTIEEKYFCGYNDEGGGCGCDVDPFEDSDDCGCDD